MIENALKFVPQLLVEIVSFAFIVELLVQYHTRKLQKELRDRENLMDDRLDKVEKCLVKIETFLEVKIEQLQKELCTLDNAKMTRPPRN